MDARDHLLDAGHKKILRALCLEIRRSLEGTVNERGEALPGDLHLRLQALGVRLDGSTLALSELPHLSPADRAARITIDDWLRFRVDGAVTGTIAVAELVREMAWTWATRLIALRCLEARGLIDDEVILTKAVYAGRSMRHNRLVKMRPAVEAEEDGGLYTMLHEVMAELAESLPRAFNPVARGVALRPSVQALSTIVGLLSGTLRPRGQEAATDEVFLAPDTLGWAYQYWSTEEKQRVFDRAAGKGPDRKRHKIAGADIIPATQLYTEPYMVRFLVENSLGALSASMRPGSRLREGWDYFVEEADRPEVEQRPVTSITFLDPACGSGHFLLVAFDLFFDMYKEERDRPAAAIVSDIFTHNLYGLDIDERAVQIAETVLWMRATERTRDEGGGFPEGARANLVATGLRLPDREGALQRLIERHPDVAMLRPALETVLRGLSQADELGALLRIDEPLRAALKGIREAEAAQGVTVVREPQTDLFSGKDRSRLPESHTDWASYEDSVLGRLSELFAEEAQSADPVAAWFGRSGEQAMAVVDLLSRRYDVVAANPPYMGSKNMGEALRSHVEQNFVAGKRDLYAAFMERCMELSAPGGRIAMVTQQSWMFLRSFADLRYQSVELPTSGLLAWGQVELVVQLGRYAFSEITNAVVAPVLFVALAGETRAGAKLWGCQIKAPRPSTEQAAILLGACRAEHRGIVYLLEQDRLKELPGSPLCFWLRRKFLELFAGKTVSDVGQVRQGTATADDGRFLRFVWEVSPVGGRWFPFYKGGGVRKWDGLNSVVGDWQTGGTRLTAFPRSVIRNPDCYFRPGWTYTYVCSGRMALRRMAPPATFGHTGPAIFLSDPADALALNSRVASYLLRAVSPNLKFEVDCVNRTPLPPVPAEANLEALLEAKAHLTATDLTERAFTGVADLPTLLATAAELNTLEGESERAVMEAYGLDEGDIAAVLADTGTPAGWLSDEVTPERRTRLRELFEAGPGGSPDSEDDTADSEDDEEAEVGTGRPIPPETFLEELCERVGLSPNAAWRALQEGIAAGWRCAPEERRLAADRLSELVLRLLGHQWPLERERGEARPDWADDDGVVPLTALPAESPLLDRLRDRLPVLGLTEPALSLALGEPLDQWLHIRFAGHHASQFKRRPIAWQLQTSSFGPRRSPAFAALLYGPGLHGDSLAGLRSQYLGPLIKRHEQELRVLSGEQSAVRARELELSLEELRALDASLLTVERGGFATPGLRTFAVTQAVESLCLPVLKALQDRVTTDKLTIWKEEADGVSEEIGAQLVLTVEAICRPVGRAAALVAAPAWVPDAERPPAPEDVRAAVVAAAPEMWEGARSDLLRALDKAFKGWMREMTETAKQAGKKKPTFKVEKKRIEALSGLLLAYTPSLSAIPAVVDDSPLLDRWCGLPGRPAPADLPAFVEQESAWIQDVNDGVRVNIAPLQRARLLHMGPLVERDLPLAIADRAIWRADERRWVREGKLDQPGWWPEVKG